MAVYADLGALVAILKKEPDLQAALLALDSISEHRAPERGDPELVACLKHAVGHLLESLNAAIDVRKKYPGVGSAFGGGRGIDRTWGAIASASHHDVALAAAEAVLEPAPAGGGSAVIRHEVIKAVADPVEWARLAENLEHEYRSAGILPESPINRDPDFADAMARYGQSRDAMRTVRLNPRTVIPVDQWRAEPRQRNGVIVRTPDWKRYTEYVLRVAAENERLAEQARRWWTWWEASQVDHDRAGPAPLVLPEIEAALQVAAVHRRSGSPTVTVPAGASHRLPTEHDDVLATPVNSVAADPAPSVEAPQGPDWIDLGPKHQLVIAWLLTKERGETFSRGQILDGVDGLHDKGNDRKVISQLVTAGLLVEVEGKKSQLRLTKLPANVPASQPRDASWRLG